MKRQADFLPEDSRPFKVSRADEKIAKDKSEAANKNSQLTAIHPNTPAQGVVAQSALDVMNIEEKLNEFSKLIKEGTIIDITELDRLLPLTQSSLNHIELTKQLVTLLNLAAAGGHIKVVELLLEKLPLDKIATQDEDGKTALHLAAAGGHTEVVKLLLEKFPLDVIKKEDKVYFTALDTAADGRHIEVFKLILEKHPLDKPIEPGWLGNRALHCAALEGYTEIVELLLPRITLNTLASVYDCNNTALHLAALKGHTKIVELLLSRFTLEDITAVSDFDKTALHCAIDKNHTKIVELLVAKLDSDALAKRYEKNSTVLHYAAEAGYTEGVALLLAKLNLNTIAQEDDDKDYLTALHLAANASHVEVIKLLLEYNHPLPYDTEMGLQIPEICNLVKATSLIDSLCNLRPVTVEATNQIPNEPVIHKVLLSRVKNKLIQEGVMGSFSKFARIVDQHQELFEQVPKLLADIKQEINSLEEGFVSLEAEIASGVEGISATPLHLIVKNIANGNRGLDFITHSQETQVLREKTLNFYRKYYPNYRELIDKYDQATITAEEASDLLSGLKEGAYLLAISEEEQPQELIKAMCRNPAWAKAIVVSDHYTASPYKIKASLHNLFSSYERIDTNPFFKVQLEVISELAAGNSKITEELERQEQHQPISSKTLEKVIAYTPELQQKVASDNAILPEAPPPHDDGNISIVGDASGLCSEG